ncbi:hypothetical protein [Salipiger mucosus]|uniref:Uncharacterized protein n=1 Tax=Salipiger mucosus DSM 16094 TaxID=1123237 RepID=S9QZ85_9RHOB|nr:hypothetical protein [Salipiger mucosus]EPX84978.1 hypothetical protein Salmuc_00575 [Salipiger mucosus DSM 16094]
MAALLLSVAAPGAAFRDHGTVACEIRLAQGWIEDAFRDTPVIGGTFSDRLEVETPARVRQARLTEARFGLSVRHGAEGEDRRLALSSVTISDMRSHDRYGAAIKTHRSDPGVSLFLADVTLRPGWPAWDSYETTNYDGLTLDGAKALYAQGLTISEWNADAAIDSKAEVTQLVNVTITGPGNRPLRFWRPGPHYLVHTRIEKPTTGTMVWFRDCDGARLVVHASRFNGAPRLSPEQISCGTGEAPEIVYRERDPRRTGEMHPFFRTCDR